MALSKIQSESMNLADTYAFTGTVSGTNDTKTYIPLLNVDTISGASSYHVDNTYINDTYDYYFVSGFLKAAADGKILYQKLYISASQDNGATTQSGTAPTSWEYAQIGGSNTSGGDSSAQSTLHFTTIGNGTGEGVHFHNHYYANNEKANMIFWHGSTSHLATNGAHVGSTTSGASGTPLTTYQYSLVGMEFYFSGSTNISSGRINVYGVKGYV